VTDRRAALLALAALAGWGCAGPLNEIVEDSFEIAEASGTPEITDVTDVGGGDVPLKGTLPMEASDGVAIIGETLWIRGRGFGRQPTVLVGGRPATVLGRTREGGIAVRVPPATPSGSQPVVVSNEIGKGERPIAVRRYAAVLAPGTGQIGWAEVGADGPIAAGRAPVPAARFLALAADGRAAYVMPAARSQLTVIELPAPGAPKSIYELDLGPAKPVALAAATRAPVLVVLRGDDLVLVDTTSPLHPARSAPRALPEEVRRAGVVAADVSPDGKLLAVATEAGNQVVLLDLAPYGKAPVVGALSVLPDVRESTLADVAFSPAGDTLWVLSGDTPRNRAIAPQPTELRAIRLASDPQTLAHLEVARVVRIDGAGAPARLGVGRARPLASGATIRLPPERAPTFVAAATRDSGSADAPAAPAVAAPTPPTAAPPPPAGDAPAAPAGAAPTPTTAVAAPPSSAAVFRVGAEDAATVALSVAGRVGLPDLSYDGRWLLVPAALGDGSIRVLAVAVDGRPVASAPRPADVVPAAPGEEAPPARPVPELRVQP
jgi:hypothetical protein